MRDKIVLLLYIVIMAILLFIGGWVGNNAYKTYSLHRDYDGLYIRAETAETVDEITDEYDPYGDWVCVNVRGMDYKEAIKTCGHETGHEIFAELIEEHPEKIDKVMEVLEE